MDAPNSTGPQHASAGDEGPRPAAPERHIVVYAAANLAEAYHLKNILAEDGIAAEVTNSLLEGGSGVDIVGWPTLPRLLVRERDAARARQIALNYDRRNRTHRGYEFEAAGDPLLDGGQPNARSDTFEAGEVRAEAAAGNPTSPEAAGQRSNHSADFVPTGKIGEENTASFGRTATSTPFADGELLAWPCCPECGRRRITQCPYCGACGSDFPLGDPPPQPMVDESAGVVGATGQCDRHGRGSSSDSEDHAKSPPTTAVDIFAPAQAASGIGCGPEGCSPSCRPPRAADSSPKASAEERGEPGDMLVVCPQCDEPFVPQFAEQCEWCNRRFAGGREAPPFSGELLNPAAIWLIFGLIAVLGGLIAWFAYLL